MKQAGTGTGPVGIFNPGRFVQNSYRRWGPAGEYLNLVVAKVAALVVAAPCDRDPATTHVLLLFGFMRVRFEDGDSLR